jgi:hypothetical protein
MESFGFRLLKVKAMKRTALGLLVLTVCWLQPCWTVRAAEQDDERIRFFETKIRPLFVEHCQKCHGEKEQESDLRLDTADGILQGGASGPTVVAGEPEESLLLVALSYRNEELQMPPDGKLPDRVIGDVRRWIEDGAKLPEASGSPMPRRGKIDLDEARRFWAFQPVDKPPLPQVRDASWPQSPIDHFILAQLEANKLKPATRADKRTLIRRVTFDLIGLPPTPDEIEAFLADDSPDAFAKVADRLLNSVRYGERWARHWLDVVRYADSNGLDENIAHGNAWRYRDYVIASLNHDKPFDQFLIEQLAGDLMPSENEREKHERLIATGFLSLGPKVLAEGDEKKLEMDIIDEQIDTVGRALMGLTLGCARCHSHKFDPISHEDYYSIAGIFKSTRTMESLKRIAKWNENAIPTADELKAKADFDKKVANQRAAIKAVTTKANADLKTQLGNNTAVPNDAESKYSDEVKAELKRLRDELAAIEKNVPQVSTAMGVTDGDVTNVRVHLRGSHLSLGKEVARGVPAVVAFDGQPMIAKEQSGRLELAHWLTRPEHPLTSRVFVNRIWRWHFGRGLVGSTDNFGRLGDRPTNQPLLDWLARDFIESGWSVKRLHRAIVLSSTYQMSDSQDEVAARTDPENHLQWRANIRRLEAEAIRDSLLSVSGLFDTSMGGSMLHVANRAFLFDHTSKDETSYDSNRRSIYLPVIRNHLFDVFSLFDYSDASVTNGDRTTSTIAPQALFLMNSEMLARVSRSLAERAVRDSPDDSSERVQRLYMTAYGRPPSADELARCLAFVQAAEDSLQTEEQDQGSRELDAWEALSHVLLSSSEFLHIR